MFSPFTEENCTGTGDVITCTGATYNNLPFSASFSDGDRVSYALRDSGGVIKIAGVGVWNSGNTITRGDTWNYNGTVVDKNPSSNIVLSNGTHTITCCPTQETFSLSPHKHRTRTTNRTHWNGICNSHAGIVSTSINQDTQYAYIFQLMESDFITNLEIVVQTADAGALAAIGITKCIDGEPENTYLVNSALDVATSGLTLITVNQYLEAGWYFIHIVTNSAGVCQFNGGASFNSTGVGWTPLRKTLYANRNFPCHHLDKATVTGGTLDPNPNTVTSNSTSTTNTRPLLFGLRGY